MAGEDGLSVFLSAFVCGAERSVEGFDLGGDSCAVVFRWCPVYGVPVVR